jgi:hypothetical protein
MCRPCPTADRDPPSATTLLVVASQPCIRGQTRCWSSLCFRPKVRVVCPQLTGQSHENSSPRPSGFPAATIGTAESSSRRNLSNWAVAIFAGSCFCRRGRRFRISSRVDLWISGWEARSARAAFVRLALSQRRRGVLVTRRGAKASCARHDGQLKRHAVCAAAGTACSSQRPSPRADLRQLLENRS